MAPPPPDPRYPTAKTAGSEGIFALEEPDRGPLVVAYQAPSREGAQVTQHGHCEVDYDGVVCGPEGSGWRLVRGKEHVIAQRMLGPRVYEEVIVDLGADGRPSRMIKATDGVVEWSRHFDASASRYSSRLRSGANALSGCGAMALGRDAGGRVTDATCLQWLGEPMRDTDGVVRTRVVRDGSALIGEWRYEDANGQPASRHDGVHRVVVERDGGGRIVEEHFLDRDGHPRRDGTSGCAMRTMAYGANDSLTEVRCLGADGKPAADASGIAVRRLGYSAEGCLEKEQYFDGSGAPARSRFAGFGVRYFLGTGCRTRGEMCLSASGASAPCAENEYAEVMIERNSRGDVVSRKFVDGSGQPGGDPDYGAFEVRWDVDERGRVVGESCHGPDGDPIECSHTGYHATRNTIDDAARVSSTHFFDTAGKPTTNLGTFEARSSFDNYDHLVEVVYLGEDGTPTVGLGASSRKTLYDSGHRVFAELLYAGSAPARYEGCFTGRTCPSRPWHAVRVVRSESGELVGNEFFDADKQLIETVDCRKKRCFGL